MTSFGFSGTIAHGAFALETAAPRPGAPAAAAAPSLFRGAARVVEDGYRAFGLAKTQGALKPHDGSFLLLARVRHTLRDHVVHGRELFPGVGYVEIAASMLLARGYEEETDILNLNFTRPCALADGR